MKKEVIEEELQKIIDPLYKEQIKLADILLEAVGNAFQKGVEFGMSHTINIKKQNHDTH